MTRKPGRWQGGEGQGVEGRWGKEIEKGKGSKVASPHIHINSISLGMLWTHGVEYNDGSSYYHVVYNVESYMI